MPEDVRGGASARERAVRRAERRRTDASRTSVARTLFVNSLHLFVLWSFAVAQPLYDVLGKNAEFFAVRGSSSGEIVAFTLGLLVPVSLLVAVEALAAAGGPRLLAAVHLVFVAALVALFAAQALKQATGLAGGVVVLASLLAAAAAAAVYRRIALVGTFMTALTPAPLVFAALFLFTSPVERLVFVADVQTPSVEVDATRPVVLVLFDEFPVTSLLTTDGEIDAERFPNFARLARAGHWFRNATTVDEATAQAVPAILTGRYTEGERRLPVLAEHPQNLFTLLGGNYDLNVWEAQSQLCPEELCGDRQEGELPRRLRALFTDTAVVYAHLVVPKGIDERLPSIEGAWGGFLTNPGDAGQEAGGDAPDGGSLRAFRRFLESLEPRERPTLHFFHSMLPHASWVFTPTCRRSLIHRRAPGLDKGAVWREDEVLVVEALRRHLLQVGCVDRLLGELIARMKETGLWERAALIVVSDHGVSVRPGLPRRAVDADGNLEDIAFVPLLVRVPGRGHAVVDGHRQSVDVFPTIADALGISVPWAVDGRSLFAEGHPDEVRVNTKRGLVRAPLEELLARRDAAVERLVGYFGSGDWETSLYASGPNPELLGRAVGEFRVVDGPDSGRLPPPLATFLADIPRRSQTVPTPIMGLVTGDGAEAGRTLAVAVAGRIRTVTETYERGGIMFAAYVPESFFRTGDNPVELFWVNTAPGGVELERIPRLPGG